MNDGGDRTAEDRFTEQEDAFPDIDFQRFDRAAPDVAAPESTHTEHRSEIPPGTTPESRTEVSDRITADDQPPPRMLDISGLDAALDRVPPSDCFPDRYERADESDVQRLAEARAESADPRDWVDLINPGADAADAGIGRLQNCAECARAVQETLDGRPTVAASLVCGGPDARTKGPNTGEQPQVTEVWADKKFEPVSYQEIEERLWRDGGSAIIAGYGPSVSGHAFNAVFVDGAVRSVDGQVGEVTDWPDPELAARFPDTSAIFFPDRRASK